MELFSKIPIPRSNHPIDYHSKIIAFGSCFAENMGAKLQYFKFQNTTNPFGILFHPLAIEKVITSALSDKQFTQKDLFFLNERWHCFDVHSVMSGTDKAVMLTQLNDTLKATRQNVLEATHCIITLGTAWAYKHIESNQIVANCHKVPQRQFEKQLFSIPQIEESLLQIVSNVKKANPNITFIFTISPVRHLKDGFVENQQSKAHLIAALHSFLHKSPLSGCWGDYFPAYEIMMDELRDYRFYADDLIHPSQMAIEMIWQRFTEVYCSKATFQTMRDVESIHKVEQHIPFNPQNEKYLALLEKIEAKKRALSEKFKQIQF